MTTKVSCNVKARRKCSMCRKHLKANLLAKNPKAEYCYSCYQKVKAAKHQQEEA